MREITEIKMTAINKTKAIILLLALAAIWIPIPGFSGKMWGSIFILGVAIWSLFT